SESSSASSVSPYDARRRSATSHPSSHSQPVSPWSNPSTQPRIWVGGSEVLEQTNRRDGDASGHHRCPRTYPPLRLFVQPVLRRARLRSGPTPPCAAGVLLLREPIDLATTKRRPGEASPRSLQVYAS